MHSPRESEEFEARAMSPPPTYDDSGNDAVVSLDALANIAITSTTDGLEPHAALPPTGSRVGSLFSRALSRTLGQTPSRSSTASHLPPAQSPDLRQTESSPANTVALNPSLAVPSRREEVVLTYQPESQEIRPHDIMKYQFSPIGPYSMVLLPPRTVADSRPLYHISWRQDYFSPLSVVTTVRKGATEDGVFVAEFGLGAIRLRGEAQTLLKEKLVLESRRDSRYRWSHNGVEHVWTLEDNYGYSNSYYLCQQKNPHGQETLAIMRPPNYNVVGIARDCQLKVYPAGHDNFEEVLLCALILTRQSLERGLGVP